MELLIMILTFSINVAAFFLNKHLSERKDNPVRVINSAAMYLAAFLAAANFGSLLAMVFRGT